MLNLNSIVEGSSGMMRFLIGDRIELRTLLAPDLANVNADATQMEQLLINFCVNARDAMPQGGHLLIETKNVDVPDVRSKSFPIRPGHYAQLSIADNGIGMDEQTVARVFEPFFTTKAADKGTGLGLATVHCIVNQSGGHVRVESKPNGGSTFFVYLPAVTESEELQKVNSTQLEIVRGSETVLLVESVTPVRTLIRDVLERFGYAVLEGEDCSQALEIAERHKDIAALLMDSCLPGSGAPALVQSLRAERPELKLLQMTAPPIGFVNYGFHGDGVDFIHKPFTGEALARKLRDLLDQSN